MAAGTPLTRAGEPGDEFFLIIDGTARAEVSAEKQVMLHPGEFFGEMSLLDGGPRSATVLADTPNRLLVISRRHFAVLLKDVAWAHRDSPGDAFQEGPAGAGARRTARVSLDRAMSQWPMSNRQVG